MMTYIFDSGGHAPPHAGEGDVYQSRVEDPFPHCTAVIVILLQRSQMHIHR